MEKFEKLLHPKLSEVIRKKGIETFTEPQLKVIPRVMEGKNVLLLSPTGSGKTEAAIFPVFTHMLKSHYEKISAIYVTPLRALNRDMLSRLMEYGEDIGLSVQIRHSDISQSERRNMVLKPPDLLITTPESLQIMLNGSRLRKILSNARFLIIDEVHELAQNERGAQFTVALERLRELCGRLQTIGLSATVGNPEELASFICPNEEVEIVSTSLRKKIDIRPMMAEPAPEAVYNVMGSDPQYAGNIMKMWELIENHTGTIVFVNTRSSAEDIAFRLRMWKGDIPVLVHHGSLSKETRETAEVAFKRNEVKALICTSSLELGIDIGTADLVVQFNSPRQVNKMIQRIGRSGHWIEKSSQGVILCNDVIELEEALAISQMASESLAEKIPIRKLSLATVANQIMLMLSFSRRQPYSEIYGTIRKAYPFRDLTEGDFLSVIDLLSRTGKIWIDGDMIGKRAGILKYYIGNISMIPSEKTYRVIDTVNKKFIGTLDEKYVVSEIEPGSYFVMKGNTWRTTRIDEDRILVEPFSTTAITPKWTGEDIPVLPEVCMRVSANRLTGNSQGIQDAHSEQILKEWWGNPLASIDCIIIETRGGEIVIQALLGTRGNFALAQILSGILTSITGESVEMDYSPYHVNMKTARNFSPDEIFNIMKEVNTDNLNGYILGSARRSRFFNGVFLYEAKKFGIITDTSEVGRVRFEKIVDSYSDTILYKDAVRKLMDDYMDLDTLGNFLNSLKHNRIRMTGSRTISKSSAFFVQHYSETVAPIVPTKAILEAIENRLMNEKVILFCTKCHNIRTVKVKDVKQIKCPICSSYLVASFSEFDYDQLREFLKGDESMMDFGKRLVKNAHLVKERGMEAVIAMAARGIGPETAGRLLSVTYINKEDFIKAILNAEIEFAKNRRFWD